MVASLVIRLKSNGRSLVLRMKLKQNNHQIYGLMDLYQLIEDTWSKILVDCCIPLINSTLRYCSEVIKNEGGSIKY